jgi:twitching motility two-component system response regulator PilH
MRLVVDRLVRQGYRVLTARDGDEALEKITQDRPKLVVLDVILPKKNGFQVCRTVKSTPDLCDVKVLLLTSKSQQSDRFWGLRQGADGYMTKPFADEELLASVARLL